MLWFWSRFAGVLAMALTLSGSACTDPTRMPGWELLGEPGLLFWVKQYYERHAVEENGICTRPLLDGATRARLIEETEEELVVELTYYYRDRIRDPDEDCNLINRTHCFVMVRCRGFGERTFTVAKTTDGLEVVDMSGPQRAGRRQP